MGTLGPKYMLFGYMDPQGNGYPEQRPFRPGLGHFQLGSYRYRSLIEGLYPIEAL